MKGIPACSISTAIESLSSSTLRQYDSTFKKWWLYCKQHNISPLKAGPQDVIKYLQCTFETDPKVSYNTLNTHRSALSLILESVGKDPAVTRVLKGFFRLRPPKRKYNITWDIKMVLDYFNSQADNEDLSLQLLTRKVASLLLLTTAQRLQTLARIRVENVVIQPDRIIITIPDHLKTTARHRNQPALELPFFTENPKICVASAITKYIEKTAPFRTEGQEFLFLTSRKPFMTASSQTIGNWIKKQIKDAGVDTRIFSAYSVKHAAVSAAVRYGVSFNDIRRTAGWSEGSMMFVKFYCCPLQPINSFAKVILNNQNVNI